MDVHEWVTARINKAARKALGPMGSVPEKPKLDEEPEMLALRQHIRSNVVPIMLDNAIAAGIEHELGNIMRKTYKI